MTTLLPFAADVPLPLVESTPCTPVVKWVGGKTRLLSELLARVPSSFGRYYEPFAGGAALFFRLAPAQAVLSDANTDLMNLYGVLAADVDGVIALLEEHREAHGDGTTSASQGHYLRVRECWNWPAATWKPVQRAAAFIYLNKTCFNGLWRVNKAGCFNVPMGRYKNPAICDRDVLRAAARALAGAELRTGSYWGAISDVQAGDFVYFDPPYVPATATANFTSYTTDGFGLDDQRSLVGCARELAARGVHVMLSNSDTTLVRELYAGSDDGVQFRIDTVKCGRGINSDASKRGAVGEVVITAGYSAAPGIPWLAHS